MKTPVKLSLLAGLGVCSAMAWAQIYTCVDAKGRKLTSDRPIPECTEREQKELNSNATVKRIVKPAMTEQEKRALNEKQKAAEEEKFRIEEEKRKNSAFLSRYPNRARHDKERNEALNQIDQVMKAASKRLEGQAEQRKTIDAELEFYKKDPKKIPIALKRQIDTYDTNVLTQKRFIADQEEEKARINARFDEELERLKALWLAAAASSSNPSSGPSVAAKK
jgi:Domain of unknown function (DUF4124)